MPSHWMNRCLGTSGWPRSKYDVAEDPGLPGAWRHFRLCHHLSCISPSSTRLYLIGHRQCARYFPILEESAYASAATSCPCASAPALLLPMTRLYSSIMLLST